MLDSDAEYLHAAAGRSRRPENTAAILEKPRASSVLLVRRLLLCIEESAKAFVPHERGFFGERGERKSEGRLVVVSPNKYICMHPTATLLLESDLNPICETARNCAPPARLALATERFMFYDILFAV